MRLAGLLVCACLLAGQLRADEPRATLIVEARTPSDDHVGRCSDEEVVTLAPGTTRKLFVKVDAKMAPGGALLVDSTMGGRLWVDGRDTGLSPPTTPIRLPKGQHSVELRDAAGKKVSVWIAIENCQTVRLLLDRNR
jgi:hypothetical protein